MFSHILGYKHRQAFVEKLYEDDPTDVLNLTQSELLKYARKYAENDKDLKDLIKTVISDEVGNKTKWALQKTLVSIEMILNNSPFPAKFLIRYVFLGVPMATW